MMNAKHTPRGKQGRMDARLHFVARCLNQKVTDNADLANEWYIANSGAKLTTDEAMTKFKEWLQ